MSKRSKKQQQQSNRYSTTDCEIRPVTKNDKWCQRRVPRNGELVGDAPFGYIVTIPYLPNQNTFLEGIDGRIVRSKKHCGKLLLQVIMKNDDNPQYGIGSFTRHEPNRSAKNRKKSKTKIYRIWNIRNLDKRESYKQWQ